MSLKMIYGVGTDILNINKLHDNYLNENDCFFCATFTNAEKQEAQKRDSSKWYYATRFAGKEAVFKCLKLPPNGIVLAEIEILNDENGAPYVNLYGKIKQMAKENGVKSIEISLSYDEPYATAFAIAEK